MRGHDGQVLAVAFDSSGTRVATASTDQTARIWQTSTAVPIVTLFGHTGLVDDVSFGKGGLVVTASADGTARTWGANGRSIRELLRGHEGAVTGAAFAAAGHVW